MRCDLPVEQVLSLIVVLFESCAVSILDLLFDKLCSSCKQCLIYPSDLLCERTISSAKNRSMRFSCFLQVCLAASKMSSVEVQNVRILETSFFIKNIFPPLNLNQCRKKNLYKK